MKETFSSSLLSAKCSYYRVPGARNSQSIISQCSLQTCCLLPNHNPLLPIYLPLSPQYYSSRVGGWPSLAVGLMLANLLFRVDRCSSARCLLCTALCENYKPCFSACDLLQGGHYPICFFSSTSSSAGAVAVLVLKQCWWPILCTLHALPQRSWQQFVLTPLPTSTLACIHCSQRSNQRWPRFLERLSLQLWNSKLLLDAPKAWPGGCWVTVQPKPQLYLTLKACLECVCYTTRLPQQQYVNSTDKSLWVE